MKRLKFKDANGKTFEASIAEVMDFSVVAGMTLEDSTVDLSNFSPVIVDSEGTEIDVKSLFDGEGKSPKLDDIAALDVTYETTHSGRNRNYAIYHSDSMEKDAASFLSPFPKPFIKNHDSYSEPMGRARTYEFKKSVLNPNRDTIQVTFRLTDEDAIQKHLDGRYQTVSIGASAGRITCNVCGHDIVKDGKFTKFCGHWRGETYKGDTAYWSARDMEYKETSVVNKPADDWAQLTQMRIITKDMMNKNDDAQGGTSIMDDEDTETNKNINDPVVNDGEETKPTLTDGIDDLLDDGQETSNAADDNSDNGDENNSAEGQEDGDEGNTGDGEANDQSDDEGDNSDNGESGEQEDNAGVELSDELIAANAEIKTLTDSNTDLQKQLDDQTEAVNTMTDEVATLTTQVADKDAEIQALTDAATTNRQALVSYARRIKDMLVQDACIQIVRFGDAETIEEAKEQLDGKKAREIEIMIDEYKARPGAAHIVKVTSPGLEDDNTGSEVGEGEDDDNKPADNKDAVKGVKDYVNDMIERSTRNNEL